MFVAGNGVGWLEAVILGLIQGLTEFLPISSSAHLRIIGPMLPSGLDPGAAFTAITQLGTELAVLVYFRQDIARIFLAWCGSFRRKAASGVPMNPDARLGWLVIVGTLPIAVLGLLFQDLIETYLRNLYLTAIMLIVFGLILGFADKVGKRQTELREMTWRDGIVFGFAQALALIPGVSRSGITMTAGRMVGLEPSQAARFSLFLAMVAISGAGALTGLDLIEAQDLALSLDILTAVFFSFISGYLAIHLMLKWLEKHGFGVFVVYRIILGAALLVLF